MIRFPIFDSVSDTIASMGPRVAIFVSGLSIALFAAAWYRLASGFVTGDGPWLVGASALGVMAAALVLSTPSAKGLSPEGTVARAVGATVVGAASLGLAGWAVVLDDFGSASMAAAVALAAILLALARCKPFLEPLSWLLFPYVFLLLAYRIDTARLQYSLGPINRAFSEGTVIWTFVGFSLVMMGGGLLAVRKSPGPGRWAGYSLVSALFLGWLSTRLPMMGVVLWSAQDRFWGGLALAATYALGSHLCAPDRGRSESPLSAGAEDEREDDARADETAADRPSVSGDLARLSSPWAATTFFGLGSVALTAWALSQLLDGPSMVLAMTLLAVALAAGERSAGTVRGLTVVPLVIIFSGTPGLHALEADGPWPVSGLVLAGMLAVVALLETGASRSRGGAKLGSMGARVLSAFAVAALLFDLFSLESFPSGGPETLFEHLAPGLTITLFGVALIGVTTLRISWVGTVEAAVGAYISVMGLLLVFLSAITASRLLREGHEGTVPIFNPWLWTFGAAVGMSFLAARLVTRAKAASAEDAFNDTSQTLLQLAFVAAGSWFVFLWMSLEAGRVLGFFASVLLGSLVGGSMLVWLTWRWVFHRPWPGT